jgi:hypothetical protein
VTQLLTTRNFAGLQVIRAAERPFTFNLLIYGDAGTGKTYFAGSADAVPAMRKVLHLDCESGANTLRSAWPDVDLIEVQSWAQLEKVYAALFAGGHDYNTIILDSLTELNDYCIDSVVAEAKIRKPDFDDVLEIRDWNKVASRMLRMIRQFRDLPMSTIFVGHMTEERDQRSGRLLKQPLLSGQLKKKLPAIPDIVLYQYVQEVEDVGLRRLLLTRKTDTCVAKARGVDMPAVLGMDEDVTMQTLYDYVLAAQLMEGTNA